MIKPYNTQSPYMKTLRTIALMVALLLPAALMATDIKDNDKSASVKWNLDRTHSNVTFSIRHFFTPVVGKFTEYEIDLNFNPDDLANSSVKVEMDVNSVNTNNERRDGHLKTADFFNYEAHPKMTFSSTNITKTGENQFLMRGNLTIKNVTKPIEIPFTLLGVADHPSRANTIVAGLEGSFKMNRLEYGVGTGDWVSTAVVSDELTVNIFLSVNRQK
jgi:polyisoprenoid-binding protein YceI